MKKLKIAKPKENKKEESINLESMWNEKSKEINDKKEHEHLPFVSIPKEGQSYNPKFESYKSYIDQIINQEQNKNKRFKLEKKKFNIENLNKKNNPEKPLSKEKQTKMEKRKASHQFNLIKKYKKEMKVQAEKCLERKEEKEKKIEDEKILQQKGILPKYKKIGKFKFQPKIDDFMLLENLPKNLRSVKQESCLFRDFYDNFARKQVIEPHDIMKRVSRKKRVPKYKILNKDNFNDLE